MLRSPHRLRRADRIFGLQRLAQLIPSRLAAGLLLVLGIGLADAAFAAPIESAHLRSQLIAENAVAAPGQQWLGLKLEPEAGWHIYWRNPGDSGLPTRIAWTLPAGVSAGAISWPYPQQSSIAGIVNYGYGDAQTLLIPLDIPANWPAGTPLAVHAQARWLICKDLCIPGSAEYDLSLPVAAQASADPAQAQTFAAARAHLPAPMPEAWKASFATDAQDLSLGLDAALPAGAAVAFFPYAGDVLNHSAAPRLARESGGLRLSQTLSPKFKAAPAQLDGVLVLSQGADAKAYELHAAPGAVSAVPATVAASEAAAKPDAAPVAPLALLTILFSAMLGGLILNVMPCVFPVLSLKAMALAQAGGHDSSRRQREALAYTAGVILSFIAIAVVLLALRAGGQALGWGFQLQSPPFVAALAYLMLVLGLSMSGLMSFGAGIMGVGQGLTERGGAAGSFFTGVLAAVVASPCTAPFMGAALGFALTQPAAISLLVFFALGLGMALPFLLLGFVPALARALPRPGMWMESFKQFLAFPLYLTSVWLLWVLARQVGADGAGVAMVGGVLIVFAAWAAGRGRAWKIPAYLAVLAALGLLALPLFRVAPAAAAPVQTGAGIEPYSDARLAELRAAHRTVFVNFTADWCITCKVNERVALGSQSVREAFRQHNVVWLEGDWTRYDPAITHMLEQFGRSGVPLYLVYRDGAEPQTLAQILTPADVVAAVQ